MKNMNRSKAMKKSWEERKAAKASLQVNEIEDKPYVEIIVRYGKSWKRIFFPAQ